MVTTIIFYILLVGLVAFLQWKVVQLRRGKIEIHTIHKDRSRKIKVLKQIIAYFGHRLKEWLKEVFVSFASWRIRSRVRLNHFIETKLPGLYTILTKRPEIEEKHTKNIFWRGVIEYKYKIQKLKSQIKEEEIQKIDDKINQAGAATLEATPEVIESVVIDEVIIEEKPVDPKVKKLIKKFKKTI